MLQDVFAWFCRFVSVISIAGDLCNIILVLEGFCQYTRVSVGLCQHILL